MDFMSLFQLVDKTHKLEDLSFEQFMNLPQDAVVDMSTPGCPAVMLSGEFLLKEYVRSPLLNSQYILIVSYAYPSEYYDQKNNRLDVPDGKWIVIVDGLKSSVNLSRELYNDFLDIEE